MKKLFILFTLICQGVFAQYNELGLFVGGGNALADVGRGTYISPNQWAWGVVYKRNLHQRLSIRADVKMVSLLEEDKKSDITARYERNWSFHNRIIEVGAGLEYHFLEFDTHKSFDVLFTPYVHTGIYRIQFHEIQFQNLSTSKQKAQWIDGQKVSSWALPLGLGVKTRLGHTRLLIGAEVGLRYTFTNNLDGSFPKEPTLRFGNLSNNDWYFVSGLYLTYTFGQRDCQCF